MYIYIHIMCLYTHPHIYVYNMCICSHTNSFIFHSNLVRHLILCPHFLVEKLPDAERKPLFRALHSVSNRAWICSQVSTTNLEFFLATLCLPASIFRFVSPVTRTLPSMLRVLHNICWMHKHTKWVWQERYRRWFLEIIQKWVSTKKGEFQLALDQARISQAWESHGCFNRGLESHEGLYQTTNMIL